MQYVPGIHAYMPPPMLSSYSPESVGRRILSGSTPGSAVWSTTNRIVYVPFAINRPVVVYKLWWLNGATVGTNNLQAAVYDGAFNRLINGTSTLSAGANICQYDNITDTGLPAGRYFMALWCNGTTATVIRGLASAGLGIYYETNASGPQATGTPVAPAANGPVVPVFGLQLRSSP
jgi:hypothetical protein